MTIQTANKEQLYPGTYAYQNVGGEELWKTATHEELAELLLASRPPMFRTILAQSGTEDEPLLFGPFYADFDDDLAEVIPAFRRFTDKMIGLGLDLSQTRISLSGGRGLHLEVPPECFMTKPEPVQDLHRIFKEMAMEVCVDGLDWRVYSKRRMWRVHNVKRPNGMHKVQISVEELAALTPETYRELASKTRPLFDPEPPTFCKDLAFLFVKHRDRERAKPKKAKIPRERFARLAKDLPKSFTALLAGLLPLKPGTGWNQAAMQVASMALALEIEENAMIDMAQGLIKAHEGDSDRYGTPHKRERELRDQFRYQDGNTKFEPSIPALLALLDQPAPDLLQAQEMLDLPDFSDFEALEPSEAPACDPDTGEMPQAGLEAFPGVMEAVVRAGLASETKPQAGLTILSALVGMAAAVPGCYEFMGTRSNLYGFGLAETGAGKDQPRRIAEDLAFRADVNRCALPASGQGLEDAVAETGRLLCSVDEIGHLFAATNASKAPGHLIEINGNLLRFFSASQGSYFTRAKAGKEGKSRTIQHPMLNVLGFSTPSALGAALSSANVLDGLLGRFLMVEGSAGVVPRFRVSGYHPPEAATALARRIQAAGAAGNTVHVRSSRAVDEMLENLQQILHRKGEESSDPAAKLLCVRSYEKVVRVALVLAVWDHPERPQIDERHVAWASSFVDASDRTMLAFVRGHIHDGAVQADAAKVSRTITALLERPAASLGKVAAELAPKQTVTWAEVLRRSKLSAQALKMAVEHLEALGDVAVSVLPGSGKGAGAAVKVITAL